jgi:signal peptide peptidase SppA
MEMQNDCKLVRVLTALMCEPWLLTPQMHKTLTDIARAHAFGGSAEQAQHAAASEMPANPAPFGFGVVDVLDVGPNGKPDPAKIRARVASVPIQGVVGRKFSSSLYSSGVTSLDVFQRLMKVAAEDDNINGIVVTIDSPGGVAMGTPEAAASVLAASRIKTVVAYVDGMCCSAAYWIASQAHQIQAMPSADIGSIGAYMAVTDASRAAEMEGIRVEMFRSGRDKGMGYPGTSLTDRQREMLQAQVMDIAGRFKAAVRSGRDTDIEDEHMQGQSFNADRAMQIGLIDRIGTFDEAVRDAAAKVNNLRGRRTA